MVDKQRIQLISNWNTLGDADLCNLIHKNTSGDEDIDFEDITPYNCVCLVNTNGDKSKAQLEVMVEGYLSSIILVSEAQIVEVFGVGDEYLLTHTAEFLDDWEGMAVYYSKIPIPNIPVCKLKFTRAKDDSRLWIYGVKIHFREKTSYQLQNQVHFNFDQITRLLGTSHVNQLSNENGITNFMQYYLQNLHQNGVNSAILGKELGGKKSRTESGIVESGVTELFSRLNVKQSELHELKSMSDEAINNSWFVSYIDKKFNEIKGDIMNELDIKLGIMREESNHKLDKIIALLEKDKVEI